jgi:hypothetical protein
MTLPFDIADVGNMLEIVARKYESVKTDKDRRFCIRTQIDILTEVAIACGIGEHLQPIYHLLTGLIKIDRGEQPPLLRPHGGKPAASIEDIRFRAHMAAAAEMFYRDDKAAGRTAAARNVIRTAKTNTCKWEQIDDWRKRFAAGNHETDIGAYEYRKLTNPEGYLVPGYAELAKLGPVTVRKYAVWLIGRIKSLQGK